MNMTTPSPFFPGNPFMKNDYRLKEEGDRKYEKRDQREFEYREYREDTTDEDEARQERELWRQEIKKVDRWYESLIEARQQRKLWRQ